MIVMIKQAFENIKQEFESQFNELDDETLKQLDISDVGNLIGYALAKYMKTKEQKDDFQAGLKHGISLKDGNYLFFIRHEWK